MYKNISSICRQNDIVDVISSYTNVKKQGNSYISLCPFHSDSKPSLNISREKQVYHCFSCGAKGNVITILAKYEGIDNKEAIGMLAERAGLKPTAPKPWDYMYAINQRASDYFSNQLSSGRESEHSRACKYLEERRFGQEVIELFQIGYNAKNNECLSDALNISPGVLVETGLTRETKRGYYDNFKGRIIFPLVNEYGKIAGFAGRKIVDSPNEGKGPKYLNSPASAVYNKSEMLYGLNLARKHIKDRGEVLIVEGYTDVITLYQSEIRNAVSICGTALTVEHIKKLSRYTDSIIFVFDSDTAGIRAAKKSIEIALRAGLDIRIVSLPKGEDPDSIVRSRGIAQLEKYIERKENFIEFLHCQYEAENRIKDIEQKSKFIKETLKYIRLIKDKIKMNLYLNEVSKKFSIPEMELRSELGEDINSNLISDKSVSESYSRDLFLLSLFINAEDEMYNYLERNVEIIDLIENINVRVIATSLLEEFVDNGAIEFDSFFKSLSDSRKKILFRASLIESKDPYVIARHALAVNSSISMLKDESLIHNLTDYKKYLNSILELLN